MVADDEEEEAGTLVASLLRLVTVGLEVRSWLWVREGGGRPEAEVEEWWCEEEDEVMGPEGKEEMVWEGVLKVGGDGGKMVGSFSKLKKGRIPSPPPPR